MELAAGFRPTPAASAVPLTRTLDKTGKLFVTKS
jgi:hypothetical protein